MQTRNNHVPTPEQILARWKQKLRFIKKHLRQGLVMNIFLMKTGKTQLLFTELIPISSTPASGFMKSEKNLILERGLFFNIKSRLANRSCRSISEARHRKDF